MSSEIDLDCDLVEVSEHMDARPEHAQWQGQIYSLSGKHPQYPDFKSSTDYGSGDGLCGWNCRHTFWPYFDGVDLAQYRDVELQRTPEEAALERELRDAQKDARVYSSQAKVLQAGGADSTVATRKADEARELVKELAEELNQHKKGKKVYINDIAISKVKVAEMSGISKETAEAIRDAHRELLKFSMEHNDSNEVVTVFNLKTNKYTSFVKGDRDTVDPSLDAENSHLFSFASKNSLAILHNHPGLSYFSMRDMRTFLTNDDIGMMTIVTNQGKVWVIKKRENFVRKKAIKLIAELRNDKRLKNLDEVIEKFLKKSYNLGVERN